MALEMKLAMEFRKYEIPWGHGKRELGILGEIHQYSRKESDFARDVVKEYDVVVAELRQQGALIGCAGIVFLPFVLAFAYSQSRMYETAVKSASDLGKEVIPIEQGYTMPLQRQSALIGTGCLGLGLLPLGALMGWLSPKKTGKGSSNITLSWLSEYMSDLHYRDEVMAYRLAEQVHQNETPVLAIVGRAHLDGLVRNLVEKQKLPLQEVLRQTV